MIDDERGVHFSDPKSSISVTDLPWFEDGKLSGIDGCSWLLSSNFGYKENRKQFLSVNKIVYHKVR